MRDESLEILLNKGLLLKNVRDDGKTIKVKITKKEAAAPAAAPKQCNLSYLIKFDAVTTSILRCE